MTLDLSHLPSAIRERAFDSNQDRIRQVRAANWVGYSRARRALERLDETDRATQLRPDAVLAAVWR
jgi:uncharacterized protein YjiS (DUF1127 family)